MKLRTQKNKNYEVLAIPFCKEWFSEVMKHFKELKPKTKSKHFLKNNIEIVYSDKIYIFLDLGKQKELSKEQIRKKMSLLVSLLRKHEIENIWINAPVIKKLKEKEFYKAMMEGLILSNYSFDKHKKKKEKRLKTATIITKKDLSSTIKEVSIVCGNTNLARDMINTRSNEMSVNDLIRTAKSFQGVKAKVFDEKALKKMGMNLLLSVGRASKNKPKLLVLEYGSKGKPIALVGKGVLYDSGGLYLKPSPYMNAMFNDKAGAITAMLALKTAAELKINKHIVAVLPLCENLVNRDAYKPGDIIKSYSGKTVEIIHTDAEGRLILADALSYAEKKYKPSLTIDVATLTGAALVMFGEYVTPVMGTDSKALKKLYQAGLETNERVWELPLYQEFKDEMKGTVSDVKNIGYNDGRYAGTITAAGFLSNFISSPWIHLDVAGPAWFEKPRHYNPQYSTGFGVRLLAEFLKK